MNFLYDFPDLIICAIFSLILIAAFLTASMLPRFIPTLRLEKEDMDFVIRTQGAIFSLCSLVLAFSLVQVQSNFRRVDAAISAEASSINNLDRILARSGDMASPELRQYLYKYAESIVNEEWPAMQQGKSISRSSQTFGELSSGVLHLSAQPGRQSMILDELMKITEAMAEHRDIRIEMAEVALPWIFWLIVTVALMVAMMLSGILANNSLRKIVMSCQALVLGLLASIVFINDQPFKGQTSVTPDALVKTMSAMQARAK